MFELKSKTMSKYEKNLKIKEEEEQQSTTIATPKTIIFHAKLNRIKEELIEWSLQIKFDCYSKIFHSKQFLVQCVWLGLFVCFSGFTAYFVSKNIIDFFEYETVANIDIIKEKPTEFPAVTICNSNPFTTQLAQQLISNITKSNFGKDLNDFGTDQIFYNLSDVYELAKMNVFRKAYGDNKRKSLGNKILVDVCTFNNQKCSEEDFTWYYYYIYGNCMQFNTGLNATKIRMTTTEGPIYGLSLILVLPVNRNIYPNLDGDGLKLFIHNKSFAPRTMDEINLKMGQAINVAVHKTLNSKWPHPYSECQDLTSFT